MTTRNYLSNANSTTALLGSGATFTGQWEDVKEYSSVCFSCKSDVAGTMYCEFSSDGSTADSTLTYNIAAGVNEVHRLVVTRRYVRLKYTNKTSAQSSFNMTLLVGEHQILTAPLNLPLGQDADALVVRSIDSEIDIGLGLRSGYFKINKFGKNPDVDSGTVPEDIWPGGGVYTGFPTGSAELVTVSSSSVNDAAAGTGARTVTIYGLDANYGLQSETITLNGTNLVDSVNTYMRVYRLIVQTSGSSNQAFNDGDLTVAHKVTTANVFLKVPAGTNKSQSAVFTVPANYGGFMKKLQVQLEKGTSASISAALWVREFGKSPYLSKTFSASNTSDYVYEAYSGISFAAKTDIAVRVTSCSTTNVVVTCNFDFFYVRDDAA